MSVSRTQEQLEQAEDTRFIGRKGRLSLVQKRGEEEKRKIDGPMTIAIVLRLPRKTVSSLRCRKDRIFLDTARLSIGSWNQSLDHRDKENKACGQYLQLLASWGASDRKKTRSRPVKSVEEANSSVDGTFQAEKDGGVGLQRQDA